MNALKFPACDSCLCQCRWPVAAAPISCGGPAQTRPAANKCPSQWHGVEYAPTASFPHSPGPAIGLAFPSLRGCRRKRIPTKPDITYQGRRNVICVTESRPRIAACSCRAGLHRTNTDPGTGDPADPRTARHHGLRADRHRQDRRVHIADAADPPATRQHQHLARTPSGARAGPGADARTCRAGGGISAHLRQIRAAEGRRGLWRHRHQAADQGAARRRRDRRRHAWPPARPY